MRDTKHTYIAFKVITLRTKRANAWSRHFFAAYSNALHTVRVHHTTSTHVPRRRLRARSARGRPAPRAHTSTRARTTTMATVATMARGATVVRVPRRVARRSTRARARGGREVRRTREGRGTRDERRSDGRRRLDAREDAGGGRERGERRRTREGTRVGGIVGEGWARGRGSETRGGWRRDARAIRTRGARKV